MRETNDSDDGIGQMHVSWTTLSGTKTTIEVKGAPSATAGYYAALVMAREDGWTPPRWWHWWRRDDFPNWRLYRTLEQIRLRLK